MTETQREIILAEVRQLIAQTEQQTTQRETALIKWVGFLVMGLEFFIVLTFVYPVASKRLPLYLLI